MLDFIGMVITAALMVLIVNALITFMDVPRLVKIVLAAVIGVWIGLAAAVAGAGWLPISRPVPVVGHFVAVPLLVAALATAWPAARAAMLSIPIPVMVALNIVRVFAVLFLMLAAEGRLTGPFPYSAAWGDIITGVVALPVLWLLKDGGARHTTAIAAWSLALPISCWPSLSALPRRGFAIAAFPRARLGGDAARALVVCSDGVGPDLADPARDHRCADPAHQIGHSRERGCMRGAAKAMRSFRDPGPSARCHHQKP